MLSDWLLSMGNGMNSLNDRAVVSAFDELPLWSAPFGLTLLDTIKMRRGINVLDIGSGTGFPALEIAQRLGDTCGVYCIDPWKEAIARLKRKINIHGITNVKSICGPAESMPFDDNFFDLIVSNNGLNNVDNLDKTIDECVRTGKNGAQLVITANLPGTMKEFYDIFFDVLRDYDNQEEMVKLSGHIKQKRKSVAEIFKIMHEKGFKENQIIEDSFKLRFLDASAMMKYYFIQLAFLPVWTELLNPDDVDNIFNEIVKRLNKSARLKGELNLTIPYACYDMTLEK